MRLIAKTALPLIAVLALGACSAPGAAEEEEGAPDTNATAPEGTTPAEPSVGYTPPEGGGVPGSSNESDDTADPDGTVADPTLPRETPNR